jgi:hypothetical protein
MITLWTNLQPAASVSFRRKLAALAGIACLVFYPVSGIDAADHSTATAAAHRNQQETGSADMQA